MKQVVSQNSFSNGRVFLGSLGLWSGSSNTATRVGDETTRSYIPTMPLKTLPVWVMTLVLSLFTFGDVSAQCLPNCTLQITGSVVNPTICPGSATGQMRIQTTTTSGNILEYRITGPSGTIGWRTDSTFINLLGGNYFVEVREQNCPTCSRTTNVIVPDGTGLPTGYTPMCPSNITTSAAAPLPLATACLATVTWTEPNNAPPCNYCWVRATSIISSVNPGIVPPNFGSGTTLPIGVYQVNYQLVTCSGGVPVPGAACSFTITVKDMLAPDLTCPGNQTLGTDPGVCTRFIPAGTLVATVGALDCTPPITVTYSATGATVFAGAGADIGARTFNKGVTTITWTVSDAAVPANTRTCSTTVTINDTEAPAALSGFGYPCGQAFTAQTSDLFSPTPWFFGVDNIDPITFIPLGAPGDCVASLVIDDPLTWFTDNCPIMADSLRQISGPTLNKGARTYLNLAPGVYGFTFRYTDMGGNVATCSFFITVQDDEPPVANPTSPNPVVIFSPPGQCCVVPASLGLALPFPLFTDNCKIDSITVEWVVDPFNIPPDSIPCGNRLTVDPATKDVSASTFCLGTSTVLWTVYSAGLTDTAVLRVTVKDTTKPVLTCRDTTVYLAAGNTTCLRNLTLAPPTITDNCANTIPLGAGSCTQGGIIDTTVTLVGGPYMPVPTITYTTGNATMTINGIYAKAGTFDLLWGATDTSGNTGNCIQRITVIDTIRPRLAGCPPNQILYSPANACNVVATWTPPTATDNCGPTGPVALPVTSIRKSTGQAAISGLSVFGPGVDTVLFFTVDQFGNRSDTCIMRIEVRDTVGPTILCRNDTTVFSTQAACNQAVFNIGPRQGSDNCDRFSLRYTIVNRNLVTGAFTDTLAKNVLAPTITTGASGFVFQPDSNRVIYTIYDSLSMKSATCSFYVIVSDTVRPTITCPTVTNPYYALSGYQQCYAKIPNLSPTAADNCGIRDTTWSKVWNATTTTGTGVVNDTFLVGTTTVTYTVRDTAGNIRVCSFVIIVQDTTKPTSGMPASFTYNVTSGCSGVFPIPAASYYGAGDPIFAKDNCGVASITNRVEQYRDKCGVAIVPPTPYAVGNGLDSIGGLYGVGTYRAIFTVTDVNGNIKYDTVVITIRDTIVPVIANCPANITATNSPGDCSKFVTWVKPTATDNCNMLTFTDSVQMGAMRLPLNGINGFNFPVGITQVRYLATDCSGNTSLCTFTVTVIDNQPPTLTQCPSNITVNNNPAQCGANVTWNQPQINNNNCLVDTLLLTTSPAGYGPGAFFPAGDSVTITYIARDSAKNVSATCTFKVFVIDNEAPVVMCPANVTVGNDPNRCTAAVTGIEPLMKSDNCPFEVTWTATNGASPANGTNDASGTVFQRGTTTVTYTIRELKDPDGWGPLTNRTASCAFTVTVQDRERPSITCPSNITLNITSGNLCSATATSTQLQPLSVTDNCFVRDTSYSMTGATVASGTGLVPAATAFNLGVTTVTYTVRDSALNATTCSFTVIVNDKRIPTVVNCPSNVTIEVTNTNTPAIAGGAVGGFTASMANGNGCGAIVSYTRPTSEDNCPGSRINLTAGQGSGPNFFPVGTYTESYVAVDTATNVSLPCSFTITVVDRRDPVITCPVNVLRGTDPADSCSANVTLTPIISDNCAGPIVLTFTTSGATVRSGNGSGSGIFARGTTTVNYLLRDTSGNTATCSMTVTVRDDDAPIVTCPKDTVVDAPVNCSVAVSNLGLVSRDNCGIISTMSMITFADRTVNYNAGSNVSGTVFPVGLNVVRYTAVDVDGNTASCIFTVTVRDRNRPVVASCPANITAYTIQSDCGAFVTYTAPRFNDACDGSNLLGTQIAGLASGSFFPKGTTTQRFRYIDLSGNVSDTCTFTVTVLDTVRPVITFCPDTIKVNNDPGICGASVNYAQPRAVDNCDIPTITRVSGLAAGATFPVGLSTVVFTATDGSSNTSTCTFYVRVFDREAPVVNCPDNVTLDITSNDGNVCTKRATDAQLRLKSLRDNCADSTTIMNRGLVTYTYYGATTGSGTGYVPSTTEFGLGVTYVNYTIRDTAGNTSFCGFNVVVRDRQIPTVVGCPSNIVVAVRDGGTATVVSGTVAALTVPAGNFCSVQLTYNAPTSADNCTGHRITLAAGQGAGPNNFAVGGPYTESWQAIDAAGNLSTLCSFTITVLDSMKPRINCQADVVVGTDPDQVGTCNSYVTLAPVTYDNCEVASVAYVYSGVTAGSGTGSGSGVFNLGTTTVTYTVTDRTGNTATCAMNVTVRDDDQPIVRCPKDTVVYLVAGCDRAVNNLAVVATDNCGIQSTTWMVTNPDATTNSGSNDVSGYSFRLGISGVSYLVTDNSGNTASCKFTVTVLDTIKPTITCQDSIVVTMSTTGASVTKGNATIISTGACGVTLSYPKPLTADNCNDTLNLTTINGLGYNANFYEYGGIYSSMYRVMDKSGNFNVCSTVVKVNDAIPPVITCPANTTVATDPGRCDAKVTYANPTGSDNCQGFTYQQISGPRSGEVFLSGLTTVVYQVTDAAGNQTTCAFTVNVIDKEAPVIDCPDNVTISTNAGVCYGQATTAQLTLTASDNCTPSATLLTNARLSYRIYGAGISSGSLTGNGIVPNTTQFNKGVNHVEYTVTDTSGNVSICGFSITVNDTEAPKFTNCPITLVEVTTDGQILNNPSGIVAGIVAGGSPLAQPAANTCGAFLSLNDPNATDNCGVTSLIQTSGFGSFVSNGSYNFYPTGTYTLSYRATDAAGNVANCSFYLWVYDTVKPTIVCPADVTVGTDPSNLCSRYVALTPVTNDNCTSVTLTYVAAGATVASGNGTGSRVYNLGNTTVTYTVTDANNNTRTCAVNITVVDDDPPSIVCPKDTVVYLASGCTIAVAGLAATVADNCPGALTTTWMVTNPDGTSSMTGNGSNSSSDVSNYAFGLGTSTVQYRVTDAGGNFNTCKFEVRVLDRIAPSITCQDSIIVRMTPTGAVITKGTATIVSTGACGVTLSYPKPATSDNCNDTLNVVTVSGLGYSANFYEYGGVYTNVYRVTDISGNAATCATVVRIDDAIPPVITCPANTTVGNDLGRCGAMVTYANPLGSDNCQGFTYQQLDGPRSGEYFVVGSTNVAYQVTDAAGNKTTCNFSVTVQDRESPVITCPNDVTINNDLGVCTAVYNYTVSATDNCNAPTLALVSGGASGSAFALGTTKVVWRATDAAGNSATCSFTVTVRDAEAPTVATCPNSVTVDATATDCNNVVTYAAPTFADNCDGSGLRGVQIAGLPSGSLFPLGTTTNSFIYTDRAGNASAACTFTVTIRDNVAPRFTFCPSNIVVNNDSARCDARVTWPTKTAVDNCSVPTIALAAGLPNGSIFPVGTTQEVWTATDAAGNVATCSFTVTVRDKENPIITCPNDVTIGNDPGLCSAVYNYTVSATDNCNAPALALVSGGASGSVFGLGTTKVVWRATDAAGNSATCSFTVTVNDTERPTIATCPSNITVTADSTDCHARATYATPTFNDNCDGQGRLGNMISGLRSGSLFPLGTTTVSWNYIDRAGNQTLNNCTFTVTVIDNIRPRFNNCPSNIVVGNDPDKCGANVNWTTPTVIDNCNVLTPTLTSDPAFGPGAFFPTGTRTISYLVTDASGNVANCNFTVTVNDVQKPTVSCPIDVTVYAPFNACSSSIMPNPMVNPTFSDNCPNPVLTWRSVGSNPVPSCSTYGTGLNGTGNGVNNGPYPVGLSTVTYTVTDASGNTNACTFKVTVLDTIPPQAICSPISITLGTDGCYTLTANDILNMTSRSSDACGIKRRTATPSTFNCSNLGANQVVVELEDNNCNISRCTTTVTVLASPACTPTIRNSYVCLNNATNLTNGQFLETVVVTAPANQIWSVTTGTNGFFDSNSPAPPANPIPIATGTQLVRTRLLACGMAEYTLTGIHVDAIGYDLRVTNGTTTLSLTKAQTKIYYPEIQFVGLGNSYCLGDAPIDLNVTELRGAKGTVTFTINGVNYTKLDPNVIGAGFHDVIACFDGGDIDRANGDTTACIQCIKQLVQIGGTQAALVCNDLVQVSLDTFDNCKAIINPDMILEGDLSRGFCFSGYDVIVRRLDVTVKPNRWDTIGNFVTPSNIGDTLYVTVVNKRNGNSCWGRLIVEDKLAPFMKCDTFSVSCAVPLTDFRVDANRSNYNRRPQVKECSPFTLSFEKDEENLDCSTNLSYRIKYTWYATDKYNNSSSCVQVINFVRDTFQYNVVSNFAGFPPDVTIQCNGAFVSAPAPGTGGTGVPKIKDASIWPSNQITCEINATYQDIVIPVCEPSDYKILRKWIVADWCTGSTWERTQLIKIIDFNPPTITGASDVTLNTNANDCNASYTIPNVQVTTTCGASTTVTKVKVTRPDGSILISRIGANLSLPVGITTIEITAKNNCSANTVTHTFYVTVEDKVIPVAVCRQLTKVGLGADGKATVDAISFDEGSWDNCRIQSYEVRRMANKCSAQTPFAATVPFNCCDVTETVQVELRITDIYGNTNSCMVDVNVEDKLAPGIICPENVTINCTAYDFDIPLQRQDTAYFDKYFGGVVKQLQSLRTTRSVRTVSGNRNVVDGLAFDNCEVNVRESIAYTLECGVGTIRRTFTATDKSGKTAVCTQTITVINTNPFYINTGIYTDKGDPRTKDDGTERRISDDQPDTGNDDIIWPDKEFEAVTCTSGGKVDPDVSGRPRILRNDKCDLVAVTYTDLVLPIQAPACFKILRTWVVVDWCQDKPLGRRWEYVQVIKVINTIAPTITSPCKDTVICQYPAGCAPEALTLGIDATDDCTAASDLKYTWRIDLGNNGSFDLTGQGSSVTIDATSGLTFGRHMITWAVEDGCGNVKTCTYTFTVKDCKKPTPIAKLLTIELMPQVCRVTIDAARVDNQSYDNCTPYSNLKFRLAKKGQYPTNNPLADLTDNVTFDGTEVGVQTIALYVIDSDGNFDYTETSIIVQSNMDPNCVSGSSSITGTVKTEEGADVQDVKVQVAGNAKSFPLVITGVNGTYTVPGIPLGNNYTVTPEKDINPSNGVTTFDLVLIKKHILGIDLLNSPYKMIAADANKSGSISTFDLVELRKLILGVNDKLVNNTSWRFVDKFYVFPDPTNPWAATFPEVANTTPKQKVDFIGVKVGDVNATASPNSLLGVQGRNAVGTFTFNVDDQPVKVGETFVVDFKAKDIAQIQGYQFTLNFDKNAVEFVDVKTGRLNDMTPNNNFGMRWLEEGAITTSWNGTANLSGDEVLFSMVFKAKTNTRVSELLSVSSRYTAAEAYDNDSEDMDVALSFNGTTAKAAKFELYQNQPNPFSSRTTIGFSLPTNSEATLKIFDAAGQLLKVVKGDYAKGYNEVSIEKSELNATGVLYYQLSTAGNTATKTMIITE